MNVVLESLIIFAITQYLQFSMIVIMAILAIYFALKAFSWLATAIMTGILKSMTEKITEAMK